MARQDQSSAAATKADIAAIMESIGRLYDANERWKDEILHANGQWKDEILHAQAQWKDEILQAQERWKDEILHANERWKDDIIRHFHVVAEDLEHNLAGIFKDRTEQHGDDLGDLKRRVGAIESHLGLVA